MKSIRITALAVLALSTLNPQLSTLFAQGTEFTYSGRLTENGVPRNGVVELEATLWDAATNGTQINMFAHHLPLLVEVNNGLFTVVLNFDRDAFPGAPRWLQLGVRRNPDPEPFTTLWPRQKILAVPYAMTAANLTGPVPNEGLLGAYGKTLTFSNPDNFFAGRGYNLTDLNASALTNGTVPEAALGNAWKIGGNAGTLPGTHFFGTTDNQPLELKVNGLRALRLEPGGGISPNVIGGFNGNFVWAGASGSTIGGGGILNNGNVIYASYATIAGGVNNLIGASSDYSAIGGGVGNDIFTTSYYSVLGGGLNNTIAANSLKATIAGGAFNTIGTHSDASAIGGGTNNTIAANAQFATIPGGENNSATNRAFAAGTRAKANHTGAFVWADSQGADFASSANNQFLIRAQGGVGIGTTDPEAPLQVTSAGSAAPQLRLEQTENNNFARLRFTSTTQPFWDVAVGGPNNVMNFFNIAIGNLMTLTTNGNLYVAGTINGRLAGDAVGSTQIIDGSVSAADVNAPTFSTTFWKTDGNTGTTPGTHFLGTTDNQPLEMRVNNSRIARFGTGENITLGSPDNRILGAVNGSTIGGGDFNTNSSSISVIGGGAENSIESLAHYSFIGGGWRNAVHTTSDQSAIVGGNANKIQSGARESFVGGGFANTIGTGGIGAFIGGGARNTNSGNNSFIGGGDNNNIAANSPVATIAGGYLNDIGTNSAVSAIGGGYDNTIAANAPYAAIPGGDRNFATNRAFAAGTRAKANHTGAFVWADSQNADFASTGINQFLIRAQGGVGIGTSDPEAPLQVTSAGSAAPQLRLEQTENNNFARLRFNSTTKPFWDVAVGGVTNVMNFYSFGNGNVMSLTTNGTLTTAGPVNPPSDRNVKTAFEPVNARQILEKVVALSVTTWAYTNAPTDRHVGPVAQDFHAAFGVGTDDKHIATVDADGVALAAIQGLNQKVDSESAKLREELNRRDAENAELKSRLTVLEELITKLNPKGN